MNSGFESFRLFRIIKNINLIKIAPRAANFLDEILNLILNTPAKVAETDTNICKITIITKIKNNFENEQFIYCVTSLQPNSL